jgi:phage tail-like protein
VANKSSYLNFLPTILWEKEPPLPSFSLGAMLRIFEKILSGIDDGEVVVHGSHEHDGVEMVINRLYRLFDPWITPPEFLEWLASWVGLEFSPLWDAYARRKITTEIAQVYLQRGLKAGLEKYLNLYTVAATRPRIAIDDCSRILFAEPEPGRFSHLTTLISQGPSVRYDLVTGSWIQSHEGLVMPMCMVVAPDGSLIVGDLGTPMTGTWSPVVDEGVWRIIPPGRYEFGGTPPESRRLGPAAWNLEFPIAVGIDTAVPWNLYVLDRVVMGAATALYQLASPNFLAANPLATKAALGIIWPVAMALDTNGHLLILDRGTPAPGAPPAAPKIIDVDVSVAPVVVTARNLNAANVIEPLSLFVQSNGDLIIGDGREQNLPTPGDLVRVDRTNPAAWVETPLLAPLPAGQNPLVSPVAIVQEDATHLYVLDTGLKPLLPPLADPFVRVSAEPATVYRVDLALAPPAVTRAVENQGLVFPTGMVMVDGKLYICDRGEYSDPVLAGALPAVWRSRSYEFGVVVYFSSQRPTTPRQRRQIVNDIDEILVTQKPAHTSATFVYAV